MIVASNNIKKDSPFVKKLNTSKVMPLDLVDTIVALPAISGIDTPMVHRATLPHADLNKTNSKKLDISGV